MKLYIMRHGESPSAPNAGVKTDADRPLSERGRKEARAAAAYLAKQGAKPAALLVSPLKRAQMTAKEVSEVLKGPKPKTYPPLDNTMNGSDLFRKLMDDHGEKPEVLVIGHIPQLGETANHLTGAFFSIKPAGIVAIETNGQKHSLLWSANPDELPS